MMQRRTDGHCVLVVEDDFLIGTLVAEKLVEAGHAVLGPIPSLQKSFKMLEEQEISAAILDVYLLDGLCFPLADHLMAENIPFIFFTARPKDVPDAYREYRVVSKTVPPETLLAELSGIL